MDYLRQRMPGLLRGPRPSAELREAFGRDVMLSNSRRLKGVTWILIATLAFYMVSDSLTILRTTPESQSLWLTTMLMRAGAMLCCAAFYLLIGPLHTTETLRPRHRWLWLAYLHFLLIYAAFIVGFTFPAKQSVGPIYVFLLIPSAFITMNLRQAVVFVVTGVTVFILSLTHFAPDSRHFTHDVINVLIISLVCLVMARLTYGAALRDFANRRTIQRRNRQLETARAEALQASQAKSDFLATISHEIRTPMNSILGMTEVALHTDLSAEQRDYIRTAHESAHLLLDVLDDILDFSRIEARKLRLIEADFDLPAVLDTALRTVRLQAEAKGLALDMEVMEDTPRFLKGDPGRLRQVLINLLTNAVKFTESGSVRLTAGPWQATDGDPHRPLGLRFSVRDTGPGVDPATVEAIFEPFSQADGSASRPHGGSGLGLAICKRLVAAMGGDIRVDSRPGTGSEFTFTARFAEGDADRAREPELIEAAQHVAVPVAPSRVLLVEDNPVNVQVEKLHLDRLGMETTVAESGTEALERLAEEDFDLVLMDLEMPGMDGYETTRRIRNGQGTDRPVRDPDVPVLAVTAHALGEVRQRCRELGMNGFVTKPVGLGELGAAIRSVVGGQWRAGSSPDLEPDDAPPVLDIRAAAASLGVSLAEIHRLLPRAMEEIGHKVDLIDRAMDSENLREITLQAHPLKSVAASIGAQAAQRVTLRLENAARRDDAALSRQRLEQLKAEWKRLQAAADAL